MKRIISRWPSRAALARDVGVSYYVAQKWWQGGNIPSRYWVYLVRAAEKRGIRLTYEELARAAARKRRTS